MRVNVIRLVAVIAGCALLIWSWKADLQTAKRGEEQASLFDNKASGYVHSKVDANSSSVDVRATVNRWAHQSAGGQAGASDAGKSVVDLITFTSTAYADNVPTSVGGVDTNQAACSVGSTTRATVTACSINTNSTGAGGAGVGYGSACSTATGGTGTGTPGCSAYVPAGGNPNNNTLCSARGVGSYPGAVASCSSGGTTGAVACSTSGGQTQNGSANGNVSCSASGNANGNSCSTTGGGTTVNCSTFAGQHLACSTGQTKTGNSGTCSASGTPTGTNTATCSIIGTTAPGGTNYDNKCTAIAYDNDAGTTATCSTSAGAAGARCSVMAPGGTVPANTGCTVIARGGATAPAQYSCSVGTGGPANSCSIINTTTGAVTAPTNGRCGGDLTGHTGKQGGPP